MFCLASDFGFGVECFGVVVASFSADFLLVSLADFLVDDGVSVVVVVSSFVFADGRRPADSVDSATYLK